MAVELASGYVSINPSTKGFGRNLEKQIGPEVDKASKDAGLRAGESFTSSFGGGLAKLGAIAAAAVAGAGIAAVVKESTLAASDLNESLSKVRVVFGDWAIDIEQFAQSAATAMGISRQEALEAAGTFGNLFKAMGLGNSEITDMSTQLVKLASDLASFNNANPADVLLALRSGLVGETEPLRQFGVNLNEARIKAEAFRLGLVDAAVDTGKLSAAQEAAEKAARKVSDAMQKHGEGSVEFADAARDAEQANSKLADVMGGKVPATLDAATKAQAVYSLILQDTTTAQGDFQRTSGGLANQMRILKAQLADGKAALGQLFLPAAVKVVTFLTQRAIPGVRKFGEAFRAELDGVGRPVEGFAARLGHAIGRIQDAFRVAVEAVKSFVGGFRAGAQEIKSSPLISTIEGVGDALGSVFGAGSKSVFDGSEISNMFEEAFNGERIELTGDFGDRLDVDPALQAFRDKLLDAGWAGKVEDGIEALYPPTAKKGLAGLGSSLDTAKAAISGFGDTAEKLGVRVRQAFDNIVTFLKEDVPAAVSAFTDAFKTGSDDMDKNAKFETLAKIGETFRGIVDTIKDNKDVFLPLATAVGALAGSLLVISQVSPALSVLGGVVGNLGTVFALLTNPVTLVLAAIAGLALAAFLAYQKFAPFRKAVDAVAKAFERGGFAAAIDEASKQFGMLWELVKPKLVGFRDDAIAWLKEEGPKILQALGRAAVAGIGFLKDELLVPLGQWVTDTGLPFLREKFGEWATVAVAWIQESAIPFLRDKLPLIIDGIIGFLRENEPKILEKFNELGDRLFDWIETTALPALQEKLPPIVAELFAWANDNLPRWGEELAKLGLDALGRFTVALLERIPDLFVSIPGQLAVLGGLMVVALFDKLFGDSDQKLIEFGGKIVGFVTGLPAKIAGAAVGMWDAIPEAFRAALNTVIRLWNSLPSFEIPGFDPPGPGPSFGGFTFGLPHIEELAGGAVFGSEFTGLLRLAETPAARPEIVTPQRIMAETFRKELAAAGTGGRGVTVEQINVTEAQSADRVIDAVNARLGWMLTTRNER